MTAKCLRGLDFMLGFASRPTLSFRKGAIALTAVAAIAGASVLASFPANAQQAVNYRPAPDCTTISESGKRAICESFKRTEAADVQIKAEAVLKKCLVQIAEFKKAQPGQFAKVGTITRENACDIAAKLPKVSASLN